MARMAGGTGYNSRNLRMIADWFRRRDIAGMLAVFVFVLCAFARSASAADWKSAEQQLAGKIAAVTGPGAVALQLDNRSSLSPEDIAQIRNGLTSELMYSGVTLASTNQAVATVNVSLSENLQNYVWIAEIRGAANDSSIVMISVPRPANAPAVVRSSTLMTIQKTLLWSEPKRILDVALISGVPQRMVVLDESSVTVFSLNGNWQPEASFPVTHERPWPRDLRGRLSLQSDHLFDAYLPGVLCRSNGTAPMTMNCNASDDPWPLGTAQFPLSGFFTSTRNYFTGALSPGIAGQRSVLPFYSAAPQPKGQYVLWIVAGLDGKVHLLDGINDQVLGGLPWGSGVMSVRSSCGSGRQVLATSNSTGDTDSVRAYEIADRDPVAASGPLDLDGVITALWTAADGSSAVAVVNHAGKGEYEAFQLTIACGQ